jgi:formylglycine-generating enzyme required for sulfatase activity
MRLKKLIGKGVGAILQSPIVATLAGDGLVKVGSVLEAHFTFSAFEIATAFQESYEEALAGISAGLGGKSKLTHSKLSREFSAQVEVHYFKSFAAQRNISLDQLLENFEVLSKPVFQDDNKNPFSESELTALVGSQHTGSITALILEQVGSLDETLAAFLAHDELLGNAVLFFFREKIRDDKRVEASLAALQREGLWADVSDIKLAQQQLSTSLQQKLDEHKSLIQQALSNNEFDKITSINKDLAVLNNSLQQVPEMLQRAQTAWQESQQELLNISKRLEEKVDHIDENVETLLAEFREFKRQFNLSNQLKAGDALTRHTSQSRELIQAAVTKLKALPQNNELIIMAGTVLSSTGNTSEAEKLFVQARDLSQEPTEKALASFNLFQIHLWNEKYEQALADLQVAIKLKPSFALHDVYRYPIIKLLGAGGMGCVFLCHDQWRENQLVVKCFWEGRKGSREEVFGEAMNMRQIASEYVPKPLDYGYANPTIQEHPYFVTEYIEDTLDGEDWLKEHGKLDVAIGIAVGFQIAKGLQVAHSKNIFHLDLKPANLLFKQTDTGLMVKIIDFGLSGVATSLREEVSASNSGGKTVLEQNIVAGTHDYGAPEQLGDNKYGTLSAKTDLFAFGATLYRLMTAKSPRKFKFSRLKDIGVPDEFVDLLDDCTEEDPNDRPSVATVIELLEGLLVVEENQEIKPGEIFRDRLKDNSEGPEMVLIPAGTFRMGEKQSVHEVSVESFAMGRYPVTVAEYMTFVKEMNSHVPEWLEEDSDYNIHTGTDDYYKIHGSALTNENHPIVGISWFDANVYTEWLREQTGQEYRLPTEAEWEYAARAGTENYYWWGNDIGTNKANYGGNLGKTSPVGDYEANQFGLYDTSGNVWEWTCSEFTNKYNGKEKQCIAEASRFVLRGGSWLNAPRSLRSANRYGDGPTVRNVHFGFRLTRLFTR